MYPNIAIFFVCERFIDLLINIPMRVHQNLLQHPALLLRVGGQGRHEQGHQHQARQPPQQTFIDAPLHFRHLPNKGTRHRGQHAHLLAVQWDSCFARHARGRGLNLQNFLEGHFGRLPCRGSGLLFQPVGGAPWCLLPAHLRLAHGGGNGVTIRDGGGGDRSGHHRGRTACCRTPQRRERRHRGGRRRMDRNAAVGAELGICLESRAALRAKGICKC